MSGEAVSRSRGSPHKAPGEAPSAQRTWPHARKGALWTQIAYDKRSGLIAFGKVNFPPGSNVFCLMDLCLWFPSFDNYVLPHGLLCVFSFWGFL